MTSLLLQHGDDLGVAVNFNEFHHFILPTHCPESQLRPVIIGILSFELTNFDSIREEAATTGACVVSNDDGDDEGNAKHPLVYVDFPNNRTSDMIMCGSSHKFLSKNMREAHRNMWYQSTDQSIIMRYTDADDCTAQTRRQNQLLMKQKVFLALHLCGLLHQPPSHNYGLMMLLRLAKMQGILINQIDRFIADNPPYPLPSEEMVETVLSFPAPKDTSPEAAPFVPTEDQLLLMTEAKEKIELAARARDVPAPCTIKFVLPEFVKGCHLKLYKPSLAAGAVALSDREEENLQRAGIRTVRFRQKVCRTDRQTNFSLKGIMPFKLSEVHHKLHNALVLQTITETR